MKHILLLFLIAAGAAAFFYFFKNMASAKHVADKANDDLSLLFRGEKDSFELSDGSSLEIYSIKHGSLAINVAGKWIYVDPVTSAALPETDFLVLPKADYILFTHNHYDHFDAVAISQLRAENTRIFANETTINELGFGTPLCNGDTATTAEGWIIEAVPAYNNSTEKLQFHPKGRDNGYVLTIAGLRIYIAGDTEVIPELALLKDIDIAFLPCNLPYTMSPEQCATAAETVSPKVLFPYHYGDTDLEYLVELLRDSGIEVRIRQYA